MEMKWVLLVFKKCVLFILCFFCAHPSASCLLLLHTPHSPPLPPLFFLLVFSRCSDSDSNDGDAGKGKFFVFFFLVLHLSSFFLLLHPQVPAFSPLVHLYFFSLSLLSLLESLSLCLHSFLCVDSADDHGFADLRAQLFHTPLSSSSPVHGADG